MKEYEDARHEVYVLLGVIKIHKYCIIDLYRLYRLKRALKHYDYVAALEIAKKFDIK